MTSGQFAGWKIVLTTFTQIELFWSEDSLFYNTESNATFGMILWPQLEKWESK